MLYEVITVVSLLLLAVPLSRSTPRQGRYGRLVIAILLFVIYYNLLGTAKVWVGDGSVPPVIGLWWVPALPATAPAQLRDDAFRFYGAWFMHAGDAKLRVRNNFV